MTNDSVITLIIYGIPLLGLLGYYRKSRSRKLEATISARQAAEEAGLLEPASLHPLVDHTLCIGCGSCISACPEQPHHHVLGLIQGQSPSRVAIGLHRPWRLQNRLPGKCHYARIRDRDTWR